MEGHGRNFHKDLEAAERALIAAHEKTETIRNPLLRMIHKGVVLTYRKLDVAVTRDLAGAPEPKEAPHLEYSGGAPTFAQVEALRPPSEQATFLLGGDETLQPVIDKESAKKLAIEAMKFAGQDVVKGNET